MKRPIPDNATQAVDQIQDRGEAQIDTDRSQLDSQQPSESGSQFPGLRRILIEHMAQGPHRWQTREGLPESLYPATFLIDSDQDVRLAQVAYLGDQGPQPIDVLKVTGKQDHTTDLRMQKQAALLRGERGTG